MTIFFYILQGIQLVSELINEYNLDVVQAYMGHIQKNAELAVRDMLKVCWFLFCITLSLSLYMN